MLLASLYDPSMGTAYYHRTNICPCCDRYDETHIGNNHATFEAVFADESDEAVIGSWQEWKDRLLAGGAVHDEYGRWIETERFIATVEATTAAERRRQYDWETKSGHLYGPTLTHLSAGPERKGCWLDADGFSFVGRAFE